MAQDFFQMLHKVEFFRDFSREEIEALMRVAQWVRFGSGATIVSEGADDLFLYVLVRGQVRVVKQGKELAGIGAGEIFGEIGALARTPRSATVVATAESYCIRFEPRLLQKLPPELELKLVKQILYILAHRLTELNRRFTAI